MKCSIETLFGKKGIRLRDRGAAGHSYVYIVWDGDKNARYIGMAKKQSVPQRISLHIGNVFTAKGRANFSQVLARNNPAYFKWHVEVLSVDQVNRRCARQSGQECICIESAERAIYDFYQMSHNETLANSRPPNPRCRDGECSHTLVRA